MTEVSRHEPGAFCWPELSTTDDGSARKFYTGLFGWSFEDTPAGPYMVYTTWNLRGKSVGAMYKQGPQEKGVPPHWNTYVSVASAEASAKKASGLGGKVVLEPFDVMEHGRMAIVQDPQGAMISLWEAKNHIGTELVNEPNTFCWAELDTTDMPSAEKFYAGLFGWGAKRGGEAANQTPYTEWQHGGRSIGGMMKIPKEWGPVPPNWLVYFASSDVDATVKKAGELGGAPIVPPTDIADMGRFAVLRDPQGAVFAVFRPAMGW